MTDLAADPAATAPRVIAADDERYNASLVRRDDQHASLGYFWVRFDGDPAFGDNRLPGAPRQYLRAELRWERPDGLYAGPTLEWVPEGYFVDNANTAALRTEPYALIGVKAGWRSPWGLTLFVEGRNLADRIHISNTNARPVATPPE